MVIDNGTTESLMKRAHISKIFGSHYNDFLTPYNGQIFRQPDGIQVKVEDRYLTTCQIGSLL